MTLHHENRQDLIAEDLWISTGQGRLFAKRWDGWRPGHGEAAPIVLFHDSIGCVDLWRDFPERLTRATERAVIAYDRLGFGRSDPHPGRLDVTRFVRDEALGGFAALRDQLRLDAFIAFGHSVGGGMAVGAARSVPAQCRALITEAAQAFVEDKTLASIRDAKQAFAQQDQLDRLRRYHGDKAEWVLSAWTESWLHPDFASWGLDDDLPGVHCPVLVMHGEHDEYGSLTHPERIGALSSGPATVEILPDCGHVPHREKPGAVLDLIRTFLGRHDC